MDLDTLVKEFGEAAAEATALIDSPELATQWSRPSALDRYTVAELTGHFIRAVGVTNAVIGRGEVTGRPIDDVAAHYAARSAATADRTAEIHENSRREAAGGPEAAKTRYDTAVAEFRDLTGSGLPAQVATGAQAVLRLGDYLLTRSVELLVHADDLAVSLGEPTPPAPPSLTRAVTGFLVDVARARHGETAVLRALTRRERDVVGALRVI